MANVSDTHVAAAKRLLLQQRSRDEVTEWAAAAGGVYEALSKHLSPVIGAAGMRALLGRCLRVNRADFPELAAVRPGPEPRGDDSHLAHELVAALHALAGERALEIATALFATFFALLTTLIGERLTWQIVQRAFSEGGGTASKETE